NGDVQINEAFVLIRKGQAQLHNVYIGEYRNAAAFPHEARRMRTLLLNRRELDKLEDAQKLKGLSIIPLSLYFKAGWLKCEIGLGKGKTNIDRRDSIKERDAKRQMERALRTR
ncbi:MAG: SsrA-binding protein, partial [Myxococcota bacterium]